MRELINRLKVVVEEHRICAGDQPIFVELNDLRELEAHLEFLENKKTELMVVCQEWQNHMEVVEDERNKYLNLLNTALPVVEAARIAALRRTQVSLDGIEEALDAHDPDWRER